MADGTEGGFTLVSQGRESPGLERFSYRPVRDYAYKETPQGALTISVCLPFDWKERDRRAGTRHQYDRQCVYLASRGMVAATADYRVRDYHGTRLEERVEDSLDAMRWFRNNAASQRKAGHPAVISGRRRR